ncbi:hypothetical protein FA95DRAFT_1561646 [Auriscalpium vulgare]|uniref:Uncharacterized protein n=1 Tax=Auriscalpium vulgare TaxID=40419 RepID=A0ACB8RLU6_9AGAM|nr:hypothetical protein FA95DRAFT_1561646 [Auriscalpium vulgare]
MSHSADAPNGAQVQGQQADGSHAGAAVGAGAGASMLGEGAHQGAGGVPPLPPRNEQDGVGLQTSQHAPQPEGTFPKWEQRADQQTQHQLGQAQGPSAGPAQQGVYAGPGKASGVTGETHGLQQEERNVTGYPQAQQQQQSGLGNATVPGTMQGLEQKERNVLPQHQHGLSTVPGTSHAVGAESQQGGGEYGGQQQQQVGQAGQQRGSNTMQGLEQKEQSASGHLQQRHGLSTVPGTSQAVGAENQQGGGGYGVQQPQSQL